MKQDTGQHYKKNLDGSSYYTGRCTVCRDRATGRKKNHIPKKDRNAKKNKEKWKQNDKGGYRK